MIDRRIERMLKSDSYIVVNKKYIRACKLQARYFKRKKIEPSNVKVLHAESLHELRLYLDSHGVTFTHKR
jgi:hypothetical protein